MKKFIALLLVCIMTFAFCSCGKTDDSEKAAESTTAVIVETTTTSVKTTEKTTETTVITTTETEEITTEETVPVITTEAPTITTTTTTTTTTAAPVPKVVYIGNARNGKLHSSKCVNLPAEHNRRYFDSKEEAIAAGYSDFHRECMG